MIVKRFLCRGAMLTCFDGGGYDRIAYLIVATDDDEVGIVKKIYALRR
jgi:hypothetical protein